MDETVEDRVGECRITDEAPVAFEDVRVPLRRRRCNRHAHADGEREVVALCPSQSSSRPVVAFPVSRQLIALAARTKAS